MEANARWVACEITGWCWRRRLGQRSVVVLHFQWEGMGRHRGDGHGEAELNNMAEGVAVAQLVERPPLDFGSGHNLTVVGSSLTLGSALSVKPA